jgi:hypothetical protein
MMENRRKANADPAEPMVYQIKLKGHLGREWTDWFEGLAITLEDSGDTVLTGPVVDQAALHGLLKKARDLGMPLVAVNCVEPGQAETPDAEQPYQVNRAHPNRSRKEKE